MPELTIAFRLLAASQVLFFALVIILSSNPMRVRVLGGALFFAIVWFFLGPLFLLYGQFSHPLSQTLLPTLIPSFTLLFVWAVFEESRIPKAIYALVLADVFATLCLIWSVHIGADWFWLALFVQGLKILLSCLAIYLVWRGRDADLVEYRYKTRWWFVGALAFSVLCVAILQVFYVYDIVLPGEALGIGLLFVFSLVANIAFVKMNPDAVLASEIESLKIVEESEDPIISNLLRRMQEERLYADHDLRVGSLAASIGVPEYQLRQKINQNLGFRNFNQFVNAYRIDEAAQKLRENARIPVLSIALDVGFRSISSFNTAFQAQFGMSATAYRANQATDS